MVFVSLRSFAPDPENDICFSDRPPFAISFVRTPSTVSLPPSTLEIGFSFKLVIGPVLGTHLSPLASSFLEHFGTHFPSFNF